MELLIEQLNKSFKISKPKSQIKNIHVLKSLDLSIEDNEIYCLLGNNGAGKSTLLNCIGGIHIPDSGNIIIKSGILVLNTVTQAKKAKQKILFNFQDPKFDSRLTAKANLDFHLRMYMIERESRKKLIEEYLKKFNLYSKKDSKVYFLSGGQKKQLENIRGFITSKALRKEDILFLTDEPTAYCDISAKKIIWEEIKAITNRGTVLFSTNDLFEAEQLINPKNGKIGFIKQGKVVFSGSKVDLQKKLTNRGNINLITETEIDNQSFSSFRNLLTQQFSAISIDSIPENFTIKIENISQEQMNEVITEAIMYFQAQNIFLDKIEKIKPSINDLFIHNGD